MLCTQGNILLDLANNTLQGHDFAIHASHSSFGKAVSCGFDRFGVATKVIDVRKSLRKATRHRNIYVGFTRRRGKPRCVGKTTTGDMN